MCGDGTDFTLASQGMVELMHTQEYVSALLGNDVPRALAILRGPLLELFQDNTDTLNELSRSGSVAHTRVSWIFQICHECVCATACYYAILRTLARVCIL
jgi:hypothetical protein